MDTETKAQIHKSISEWKELWRARDPEGYENFERERQEEKEFYAFLEAHPEHKQTYERLCRGIIKAARWKP